MNLSDKEFDAIINSNQIYGDNFSEQEIKNWFDHEKNASYELYEEVNTSEYDIQNEVHVYSKIRDKQFSKCLALGAADGGDIAPLAPQPTNVELPNATSTKLVVEIVFVSTETLSTARELPARVVNVPAAGLFPPMVAPSIAPPSISGVLMSGEVRVLFVSVCVLSVPTRVVVDVGSVIVTLPLNAEWGGACSRA